MATHKLFVPYRFPSLNEYINACRHSWHAGAKMKRQTQDDIGWYINTLPEIKTPVIVNFTWIEKNRRRDLDNIFFAKKFILDSLVECGKLKGDGQRYIQGFTEQVIIGDECGVLMEIEEVNE